MPLLMLILVALALSLVALFIFISSEKNFGQFSQDISLLLSDVNFAHQYVLKSAGLIGSEAIKRGGDNAQDEFVIIAAERNLRLDSVGNFFGKIRNKEFIFSREGELYKLEINELFVRAEQGDNKIERKFDIEMYFDSDGNVKRA